jgi:hypothetical protein
MVKTVRSGAAVDYVTAGTYKRSISSQTGISLVGGTEVEVLDLASTIHGGASADALFSWLRGIVVVSCGIDISILEWMIFRCKSTDALQDLNDAAVVELAQKEGRLFARGVITRGQGQYASPVQTKFEFYNVKLAPDEELRMVLRPIVSGTAAAANIYTVLEWRQVGV